MEQITVTPTELLESGRLSFDVNEAAHILGVSPALIYRAAAANKIPSLKMGWRVKISLETIQQLRSGELSFESTKG